MNAVRLARIALVAGFLLLAGCATKQHSRDLLHVTLYDYSGAIRWNNFAGAAALLDPKLEQPVKAIDMKRYEQVQVTGYDVRGSEMPTPETYNQVVEIRLINRHTQAERSIVDKQRWRYDAEARQWWLTSGLPDITEGR